MERSGGSPAWGMDLCLGTVSEMEGGPEAVRRAIDLLGPRGRIFYVHLRQVQGTVPRFQECFIGEGSYDAAAVIRQLISVGFDGFLLDDHVPHMTGDSPYGHRGAGACHRLHAGPAGRHRRRGVMRIVVTGAAGGIGRWVVADLVAHGHDVVAVDRNAPGSAGSPGPAARSPPGVPRPRPTRAARRPPATGVTWHLGDARDAALLERAAAGADALIHLAALPTPLLATAYETFSINTQATFTALEAAGVAGVGRVVIASSISQLGLPYSPVPISPIAAPIDDRHPNIGVDPYALSKEVDERTLATMHRRHGYQAVALRISGVAPVAFFEELRPPIEADPGTLANELWAYLDSRDAARAFALAVEKDIPGSTSSTPWRRTSGSRRIPPRS